MTDKDIELHSLTTDRLIPSAAHFFFNTNSLIASIHSNRLSSNRRKPNSSETTTNLFFSFAFSLIQVSKHQLFIGRDIGRLEADQKRSHDTKTPLTQTLHQFYIGDRVSLG